MGLKITPDIKKLIKAALAEDVGPGDVTTKVCVTKDKPACARIIAKEEAVVSGLDIAAAAFTEFDKRIVFKSVVKDGRLVKKGTVVARIRGRLSSILTAERVALNFLGRFSGISTLTRKYVDKVKGTKVKIMDTRKTTPLLRAPKRHAVKCGGGTNHRFGLFDQILVKDNHLKGMKVTARDLEEFSRGVMRRAPKGMKVEIEADNLAQFKAILAASPDSILLDNMSPADMKRCVSLTRKKKGKRPILEATGGITLRNVRRAAKTGVDRISIGQITHSAPSADFSLEIL